MREGTTTFEIMDQRLDQLGEPTNADRRRCWTAIGGMVAAPHSRSFSSRRSVSRGTGTRRSYSREEPGRRWHFRLCSLKGGGKQQALFPFSSPECWRITFSCCRMEIGLSRSPKYNPRYNLIICLHLSAKYGWFRGGTKAAVFCNKQMQNADLQWTDLATFHPTKQKWKKHQISSLSLFLHCNRHDILFVMKELCPGTEHGNPSLPNSPDNSLFGHKMAKCS